MKRFIILLCLLGVVVTSARTARFLKTENYLAPEPCQSNRTYFEIFYNIVLL
jgi:hypothetical protein